ncbi:hypothetical protein YA29_16330, partial [Klebsiella aerogenes]|uniref:ESPR-type extended signal peptide-containing protein n=1 Tax=Klebsiella aerogenes TaxID=548 RepID=UPI00063C76A8
MNKSYKIVWSDSTQDWVVVGEFASGKKKTKTTRFSKAWQASLMLAGVLSTSASWATDIDVSPFSPTSDTIVISGNDNLIQGNGKGFAELTGNNRGFDSITIQDALAKGILTAGTEFADAYTVETGNLITTTVIDPVTGNKKTIKVYDNDAMKSKSMAAFSFANHFDVGPEGQYVDKFIYDVAPSGALNVGVGDTSSSWMNDPANFVNIKMKSSGDVNKITSAVYKVEDGGALNYTGKTIVSLGNIDNIAKTDPRVVASFNVPVGKTIDTKIGSFAINTFDDVKSYNTALIQALQENRLSEADYTTEFNKALKFASISAVDDVTSGDPVTATINKTRVAYIYSTGPSSSVNVAEGANIQLFRTDASLIRVENGAKVSNAGTIGTFYNTAAGAFVISADHSSVHNTATGVIDAGTNPEASAFNFNGHDQADTYSLGSALGVYAKDSDVTNDGVINVASPQSYSQQYGIQAVNSGTIVNNGAINVASTAQTGNVLGNIRNAGVLLQGAQVSMVNNGNISVGRSAQRSLTDASEDVAVNQPGIVGVSVAVGSSFTNNGDITTGALTHGVTAIQVVNAGSTVEQKGTITLNSAYAPNGIVPAQSVGIDVGPLVTQVDNSGTIILNGVNSVGLNVHENAQASNSGTIVVAEGIDSVSKTANYGIQSHGKGAKAILTGHVQLKGDGAIGVYVRDGGVAEVNEGSVDFLSGVNQTGYVIHGADSSITNSHTVQSVSTDGSTLYRISGGAAYAAAGGDLTASGTGSTILLATGRNDDNSVASNINTAGMTLRVNGQDATALRVEGGAEATIDASTNISLAQKGATAGIVRGGSTTITGEEGPVGSSVLNSAAVLNGDNVAVGALGYKVLTGGTLNHSGTIDLAAADSTGVLING